MEQVSKKILIVGQHFWPESFRINDIADFFANEKNCQVDVLCGIPNYPSGKIPKGYSYFKNRKQTHNNINIQRVFEIPRGNNSNIRIFLNYISFPIASLFHIPKLLIRKYDKIFIYQLSPVMMSIAGIILGKLKRTETTMYVLDLWPENLYSVLDIKNPLLRRFIRSMSNWHYKNVDKLVVLSESMKKRLNLVSGLSSKNILVVPQACEQLYETHVYDEELHRRFNKKFSVVFTGNISPAQSFDTIIDAAQIIKSAGIVDIHWVIVGDGMSRKKVEAAVRSRKLNDVFSFEGAHPIEDMPKYAELADVLVGCLVKSELLEATIPAKVISYIASAKPIVLAMDGEVQTLINQTIKCGYAGDTEDADMLAENILKIYRLDRIEREALGERARKYHHTHLSRGIVLNKLFRFIFRA